VSFLSSLDLLFIHSTAGKEDTLQKKPRKKQYKILQKTQNLSLIISIKTSEKKSPTLAHIYFKKHKKKLKKKACLLLPWIKKKLKCKKIYWKKRTTSSRFFLLLGSLRRRPFSITVSLLVGFCLFVQIYIYNITNVRFLLELISPDFFIPSKYQRAVSVSSESQSTKVRFFGSAINTNVRSSLSNSLSPFRSLADASLGT